MIPKKLELTNFLSYRDTVALEFDGIQLACIAGPNGAGKSSLLDAMTWALFGKSRSRSDDDLVNRVAARQGGGTEVRFTFALEDSLYRIIRQKTPGRTSVSEYQMAIGIDKWRTMSEGGVRQTQAAIENLLRMNFDTFVNASFFLQGQADAFTTKTAGQRKEILAGLLRVNRWDRYREEAARRRREEEERQLVLDARLQEIEGELGEQEAREMALQAARTELALVTERLQAQETILQQMQRVEAAIKQQKQQVQQSREALTRAEGQLARLQTSHDRRQKEQRTFQALLDEAEAIAAAYEAWQEATATLQGWQDKREAFNELREKRRPHELALERARTALEQRQKALEKQRQQAAAMCEEKKTAGRKLEEGKKRLATVEEELQALAAQEEAWHEARGELQRLQGEYRLWQQELARLTSRAQRVAKLRQERDDVAQNLADAQVALASLEEERTEMARKRERHAQALGELDNLRAEQNRLRESMEMLSERLQKLEGETGGECPVCGQALSEAHRQQVLAEVRAEGKQQGDRFRANKTRIEELATEVTALEQAIKEAPHLERDLQAQQRRQATAQARLEETERLLAEWEEEEGPARLAELQEKVANDEIVKEQQLEVARLAEAMKQKEGLDKARQQEQRHISAVEARLAEIERTVTAWETEGQQELATLQTRLAVDEIAPEAQAALAALQTEVEALGYDETAHRAARQARDDLSPAADRYQELKQAEAAVKPLQDSLADLARQIEEQETHISQLCVQHEEALSQLEALAKDDGDLQTVEKEVLALREEVIAANRKVGAAQQRLAVLDDLRRQRQQEKARRAEITQRIQRLKLLEKACGRDGVQALLIEQALPEIEEDANELLERLTGGAMRVTFETQRELKSRDALAETLDIRISDSAGERPYESFSGGEQFRVNFAIRLALSRILAKRAGARLQTLIIDEGFGSQDPSGRQRLVEAINMIKDDFACILIITHIDELRDAFPTRIEVEKGPTGSRIAVV